jgi:hypothetical protein
VWLCARTAYLAYLVIFRSFLYVLTAWLLLYFSLNSAPFQETLQEFLTEEFPGTIEFQNLQWGPLPTQARLVGVSIMTPEGVEVIRAEQVFAEVDLLHLATWLVPEVLRGLGGGGPARSSEPIRIRITRAEVEGFHVLLDLQDRYRLQLIRAFTEPDWDKEKPPTDPPTVIIEGARVARGTCTLILPHMQMEFAGIQGGHPGPEAGFLHIHDDIVIQVPNVALTQGTLTLPEDRSPFPDEPLVLEFGATQIPAFGMQRKSLHVPAFASFINGIRARGGGDLYFGDSEAKTFKLRLDAQIPETEPLTNRLIGDWAEGSMHVRMQGSGLIDRPSAAFEIRSEALSVRGLGLSEVEARGSITHPSTGWHLALESLEAAVGQGRARISDGTIRWGEGIASADVQLTSLPLEEVLRSPLAGEVTGVADVLKGELSGELSLNATFLDAPLKLQIRPSKSGLQLSRAADAQKAPLGSSLELSGDVTVEQLPEDIRVHLDHISLRSGRDVARVDGVLGIQSRTIDAKARVDIADLATFLRPLNLLPMGGAVHVEGVHLTGDLQSPHIDGASVRASGFRVKGWDFGNVRAQFSMADGLLRAHRITVEGPMATIRGEAEVALLAPARKEGSPIHWRANRVQAQRVDIGAFVPEARGQAGISAGSFRGNVSDPIGSLKGKATVQARNVTGLPEPILRARADIALANRTLELSNTALDLGPGGRLRITDGSIAFDASSLHIECTTDALRLEHLKTLSAGKMDVAGEVAGSLEVTLGARASHFRGDLSVRSLRVGALHLGDGDIRLEPSAKHTTSILSNRFFHGANLREKSQIELAGMSAPRRIHLEASVQRADLFDLLPTMRRDDISMHVGGDLRLNWSPGPGLRLGLVVPDGGVEATLFDAEHQLTNAGEMRLETLAGGDVSIDGLRLKVSSRIVELCGVLSQRGAQDLHLRVGSSLDLLGLEKRVFSVMEGSMVTVRDAAIEARHPPTCLSRSTLHVPGLPVPAEGSLHIMGPIQSPVLQGTLVVSGMKLRPRARPLLIQTRDRMRLVLRAVPGPSGPRQSVALASPVRGVAGDGTFTLEGSGVLDGWQPDDLDLKLNTVNLDQTIGSNLRLRLNTDLTIQGERMRSRGTPATLAGDIHIIEGAYVAKSATGASIFSGATRRKLTGYSSNLVEALPWLGPTQLDLRVQGSNFTVQVAVPMGDTDMELRLDNQVGGTLASPEITGRIDILPGGILSNTVINRRFEVVKAALDFSGSPTNPSVEAEFQTEVTYLENQPTDPIASSSQALSTFRSAGAEEKTVVITAHIEGRADYDQPGREWKDIELQLTSDSGSYGQAELMPLLISGVPPGQSAQFTSESGATVPLLATELSNLLTGNLLGAFVDDVNLGLSLQGGVDWGLSKSVGESLRVQVRGTQDATGQQRVEPNFEFKINDRLSLEGSLRYLEEGTEAADQVYETKIRYRIPLD